MTADPVWLPEDRPLAIAHRAGNHLDAARRAFAAGADLIETDVWSYRGRLELRHVKTMGQVPLLWDRWRLEPGWRRRLVLADLLWALPADARLFLDLKGEDLALGQRIIETVSQEQPGRTLFLCGRNWRQLDAIAGHPGALTFYSVGSDAELAAIWPRLRQVPHPAISIHRRYLTPETTARFKALGTMIVTWPINSITTARGLHELGVDGFTTDNLWLIERIARARARSLHTDDPPEQQAGTRPATTGAAPDLP